MNQEIISSHIGQTPLRASFVAALAQLGRSVLRSLGPAQNNNKAEPGALHARGSSEVRSHLGAAVDVEVDEHHRISDEDVRREIAYRKGERRMRKEHTELQVGQVYEGVITGIYPYGIFVTFDNGECGLVFQPEVHWHGEHEAGTAVAYRKGHRVEVEVIHFRAGYGLALSLKRPRRGKMFAEFAQLYQDGDWARGVVTSIKDYGVFVRLYPSVDGLLHVSVIDKEGGPGAYRIGQPVQARIGSIDLDKRLISLDQAEPVATSPTHHKDR